MTDFQQKVTGEVLGFSDDGNWLMTITNAGSNEYTVFDFYGIEGEKESINITNPEGGSLYLPIKPSRQIIEVKGKQLLGYITVRDYQGDEKKIIKISKISNELEVEGWLISGLQKDPQLQIHPNNTCIALELSHTSVQLHNRALDSPENLFYIKYQYYNQFFTTYSEIDSLVYVLVENVNNTYPDYIKVYKIYDVNSSSAAFSMEMYASSIDSFECSSFLKECLLVYGEGEGALLLGLDELVEVAHNKSGPTTHYTHGLFVGSYAVYGVENDRILLWNRQTEETQQFSLNYTSMIPMGTECVIIAHEKLLRMVNFSSGEVIDLAEAENNIEHFAITDERLGYLDGNMFTSSLLDEITIPPKEPTKEEEQINLIAIIVPIVVGIIIIVSVLVYWFRFRETREKHPGIVVINNVNQIQIQWENRQK